MKRREFVTTAAMTVPLLASPLTASARRQGERRRRPPNVVLILADDLGYECLRCNNPASPYRTPRLDALAASGVRFTNAHATPLCTPTRVQMMTGKYNFRNYTEFGALKKGEETFAHLLRGAG
ncbi:MAG TPA: sulfatase-like hydrolase/transferase, partial [Armatimonadaceae bacterium]|nr:sulfatase-like hydrolase/transferase [Armatimonadaceae bacterium]